jgi:hydrogenase expression/formation protein HypC
MCIGFPMQIRTCDGFTGIAWDGTREHRIDLALTGPLKAGTWVLTFLGSAREVLDPDEAKKIRAAVRALQGVMAGSGDLGDAFADLENRGPQLPLHLQAAHDAGKTTG